MTKRVIAWVLCVVLTMSLTPGVAARAENREIERVKIANVDAAVLEDDSDPCKDGHTYEYIQWAWVMNNKGECIGVLAGFVCGVCSMVPEMEMADLTSETIEATCTEDGWIVYTASVMYEGKRYSTQKEVMLSAKGHSYGEPEWIWEEDETGYRVLAVFTCKSCEESIEGHCAEIEAEVISDELNATCMTEGEIVYTAHVTFNGEAYTERKVDITPPIGHSYGEPEWEWWEVEPGYYEAMAFFECGYCLDGMMEHAETENRRIEPTCTESGEIRCIARVLFDENIYMSEKRVMLPAEGHSYGEPEWNWEATADGYQASATFICEKCEEGAEGHRVTKEAAVSSTTTATCTIEGRTVYTASVEFQGETYTNPEEKAIEIPAKGHSYGEPEWTWTETEEGWQAEAIFNCTVCEEGTAGHRQTIESKITSAVTPATCTEAGEIVYTASVAFEGKKYTDQKETELPAKGHSYGEPEWMWKETEDENGTKGWQAAAVFTCTECGEGTDGHSVTEEAQVTSTTTPATCTEKGETIYTASVTFEGEEYTSQKKIELPAKGHSCGEPKWSWGELADGYIAVAAFTCKECGYKETKAAAVDKITDGEYADGKAETYLASVEFEGMLYLDRKEVQKETGETHSLKKTDAKAATCTKAGNRQYYTCTTCGKYFSDAAGTKEIAKNSWIIKAAGHSIIVREKKRTAQKEGSLTYQCAVCGYVEKVLATPRTTRTVSLGSSAKLLSNPAGCTFKLDNAPKYAKYFKLNSKTGKVTTSLKKLHSVKMKKSVPVKVKVGGKTYKVAVKLKIPKPSVKIIKSTTVENGVQVYHYTFKYNIKGATRVKVRAAGMNTAVLDRYLSRPKSNSESYVSTKRGSKIRFTIVAYYGKNVSEPLVVMR